MSPEQAVRIAQILRPYLPAIAAAQAARRERQEQEAMGQKT